MKTTFPLHWKVLTRLILLVNVIILAGCATHPPWNLKEIPQQAYDTQTFGEKPDERDPSEYWEAVHQSSFYLIENSLDLSRQYRRLFGRRKESYDVDVLGRVPNSSWFTNRLGTIKINSDEIHLGPNTIDGPDFSGPWAIIRAKTQGVTPGFFIRDPQGKTFILKFDPLDHPELTTGAEIVSTKIFYACGYSVPENYLVTFDPSILQIEEGLKFKNERGEKQLFTQKVLNDVLENVPRKPDGRIRAIASRFLPGKPLGPFSYKGCRRDDPNDRIPHQHRRELRALNIFAQLVNHFDTKQYNSLDIWVDMGDTGYVKHYLIDFGSTLGSAGYAPMTPEKGYAYGLDLEQALVSLITFGMRRWSWEGATNEGMPPSVGYFESERFSPVGWKPHIPNPAFDNMTYADAYWATRILASFSEDHLRACVEAGQYSDPAATEYLLRTLLKRRRKIIDHYYSKINPLDEFRLESRGTELSLIFEDRWVIDGVGTTNQTAHRFRFGFRQKPWGTYQPLEGTGPVIFDIATLARMNKISQQAKNADDRVFHVQLQSKRNGKWGKWVRIYIFYNGDPTQARIVGIERDI